MRASHLSAVAVLALSALALPAGADSTNAPVKLGEYVETFDPQTFRWVNQEVRDYVAGIHANYTAGTITDYVVAVSPTGNWGSRQGFTEGVGAVSVADLARQALEQCEFYYVQPCYLISVNGNTPVESNSDLIRQERMLDAEPGFFDYARVPFLPEADRRLVRDYDFVSGNRALAISDGGTWAYRSAETIPQAITDALAACKEANAGTDCYLYAVNRMVVMEFGR